MCGSYGVISLGKSKRLWNHSKNNIEILDQISGCVIKLLILLTMQKDRSEFALSLEQKIPKDSVSPHCPV